MNLLEANFQILKIPGFPIHFAKKSQNTADFDKSYLGTRIFFFDSVKSICFPLTQIWKYVQVRNFNSFWPEHPPIPLNITYLLIIFLFFSQNVPILGPPPRSYLEIFSRFFEIFRDFSWFFVIFRDFSRFFVTFRDFSWLFVKRGVTTKDAVGSG